MLSLSRADKREDWFAVGACLHNIDVNLLLVWIEFSEKSGKFEDGECEKMWDRFTPRFTVRSLYYWAKLDSPEEFKKFKESNISSLMNSAAMTKSHNDIARVVHAMFKDEFVSTVMKEKPTWFL
jgi:hypothetical protein